MAAERVARSPPRRRPRLSRPAQVGLGLLFTFVGLALISLLLPSAPGALGRLLAIAGAGMLLLWVGGILMGAGNRPPSA
jgi:hypothetical protein